MTERELFYKCVPDVAGLIVECMDMDARQYREWKKEVSEAMPAAAVAFMGKVFRVIDAYVG